MDMLINFYFQSPPARATSKIVVSRFEGCGGKFHSNDKSISYFLVLVKIAVRHVSMVLGSGFFRFGSL
jgi:hypothetical protein